MVSLSVCLCACVSVFLCVCVFVCLFVCVSVEHHRLDKARRAEEHRLLNELSIQRRWQKAYLAKAHYRPHGARRAEVHCRFCSVIIRLSAPCVSCLCGQRSILLGYQGEKAACVSSLGDHWSAQKKYSLARMLFLCHPCVGSALFYSVILGWNARRASFLIYGIEKLSKFNVSVRLF